MQSTAFRHEILEAVALRDPKAQRPTTVASSAITKQRRHVAIVGKKGLKRAVFGLL